MQRLVCSLLPQGNQKIQTNPDVIFEYSNKTLDYLTRLINNFTVEDAPDSQNVACSGWDIEPWKARIEKSRFILSAKL
jgi:hypothetical protein